MSSLDAIASRYARAAAPLLLAALAHAPARAQEPTDVPRDDTPADRDGRPPSVEWNQSHLGLLRARDLTPFGFLRLDMLPARSNDAQPDGWGFELQYAYQNTFTMSNNVLRYLAERNVGRQPLRPQDAAAILALPGDAYYFDGEIGLADLIVHRRLGADLSASVSLPYIQYGRSALDGTIETFHDAFDINQMGRDLVARNQFQFLYDIGGTRVVQLDRATSGGFGDPVFSLRYSLPYPSFGWDVIVELAAKIPIAGRRSMLSTGRSDYGAQFTLQRRVGTGRQVVYLGGSAVYYAGGPEMPGAGAQIIPTLIAGYSVGLTPTSSFVVQGYASPSVVQHSTSRDLTANKYLVSAGFQGRHASFLWSFAIIENVRNYENTPDVGVQFGLSYLPRAR